MTTGEFWSLVDRSAGPDACWPWTGRTVSDPYGRLKWNGSVWRAHRLAYYLMFGELPEAVCHRCDNPPCVNPVHLRAGTASDNTVEMWAKGRGSIARRLTNDGVEAIRSAGRGKGRGRRSRLLAAARANGVSIRTAYRVMSGTQWCSREPRNDAA